MKQRVYCSVLMGHPDFRFWETTAAAIGTAQTVEINMVKMVGCANIEAGRNTGFSEWYFRGTQDYFMHLDDDLELLNITADNNLFDRLAGAATAQDVVGGTYAKKAAWLKGLDLETAKYTMANNEVRGDLRRAAVIPGGCMMIRRDAAKVLIDHYPDMLFYKAANRAGTYHFAAYMAFIAQFENGDRKYLVEDVAYSARCIEAGLNLWIDTKLRFRHWGWHGFELPPTPA